MPAAHKNNVSFTKEHTAKINKEATLNSIVNGKAGNSL